MPNEKNREDAMVGTLLGTALGDALGLPCEGMKPNAIARRFGQVTRFHLLGQIGFVSDDTEQSALVAQSILKSREVEGCTKRFRRSLLGWFLRLPWGVGLGTLRACIKIALGFKVSGVVSAGNGAAMRAGIIGAVFAEDRDRRLDYGRALAEVTHRDRRGVEGALFVAELAALCTGSVKVSDRMQLVTRSLPVVQETSLREALQRAIDLADKPSDLQIAAEAIGTSGFVNHSVPFAAFCFIRFGEEPLDALTQAISAGGDTDTNGAILGGWLGALHGAGALPGHLIDNINDGPFGPRHLRALGLALASGEPTPQFSAAYAFLRNLALYPVILAHGFRRLLPF